MIMNPIFASGARRRMRSWRVPIIVMLFGVVMLFIAGLYGLSPLMAASMTVAQARRGLDSYVYLTVVEFFLIVIVAPAMTAGSIAGERERQTLEMMLVTKTGSFRIAMGKLLESFSYQAFLIIAMLPFNCSVLVYGAVALKSIFQSTLFLLITAFAASSVGLFCSTLFKKTVTATVVAYIAVLTIGIATLIPLVAVETSAFSDMDVLMQMTAGEMMRLIPAPVYVSPIAGLLMLLAEQSGILQSTIQAMPGGYWMFFVYEKIGYGTLAVIVMINMAAAGTCLTALSAFFVRPRVRVRRRK